MKKILVIFGTRPEAIKMAPVILELKEHFSVHVCVTAQHREMLDQVLELFEIVPDTDLNIMKPGQDLFQITIEILSYLKDFFKSFNPDIVLVHGDTTTSMVASLSAFYNKIPVGHIESGLRTHSMYSPFPEEINRQLTARMSSLHFAPTDTAKNNLINENIPLKNIHVTGNTIVDSLLDIEKKSKHVLFSDDLLRELVFLNTHGDPVPKIILVTGHRRENFGKGFEEICNGIKDIATSFPEIQIVYPVHLNPNVSEPTNRILSNLSNVYLIKPLEYLEFVKLMSISYLILTDSGGIQEEAPTLGIPVLLMRDTTERPEAVDAGSVKLVGASREEIFKNTKELLLNSNLYNNMCEVSNPFGDGTASKKIREVLQKELD